MLLRWHGFISPTPILNDGTRTGKGDPDHGSAETTMRCCVRGGLGGRRTERAERPLARDCPPAPGANLRDQRQQLRLVSYTAGILAFGKSGQANRQTDWCLSAFE